MADGDGELFGPVATAATLRIAIVKTIFWPAFFLADPPWGELFFLLHPAVSIAGTGVVGCAVGSCEEEDSCVGIFGVRGTVKSVRVLHGFGARSSSYFEKCRFRVFTLW